MKFLKNWTIDLNKLPVYSSFKTEFVMELDYKLLELIYESENPVYTEDRKKLLLPLLQAMNKSNIIKVKHSNRFNLGRFYPNNSLSPICVSRHIKHTLFSYLDWCDLDMVKGHPSILYSIAKNNNIHLPYFEKYLLNPQEIFTELSNFYSEDNNDSKLSNDDIKLIFNLHIYGGGHSTWLNQMGDLGKDVKTTEIHQFEKEFKKECKLLIDLVYNNNKAIADIVKGDLKDEYKIKNKVMSYFCGTIENEILHICYKFLTKKGIIKEKSCALEYDGLCFKNTWYDMCDSINELNYLIKSETKIDVKVKLKQYSSEYIHNDIIERRREINAVADVSVLSDNADDGFLTINDGVWNDKEASQKVFKLYPHWVCCSNKLYVFDEETGMWNDNRTSYYKVFQKLENELIILATKKDGEVYLSNKSYGNTLSYMDKLPELIKTHCVNNNWLKEKQNSSLGKILFNNGYYDFHKGGFYDKENGFNPEIVFMGKIHHDFEHFNDEDMEYMEDIKQRFFVNPLGVEMGEYFILNLARGLAGDMMKRILFGLGDSNCGKSIITSAVSLACGDYAGSFNAENLAYRNTSNDEGQINRWAMLLRFKRLIFSNEIKSTVQLNGNAIKKISSGGDYCIGRGHNSNEEEFIPQFLAIVMANDLPKIKPYDDAVDNRTKVISYSRQFVENPTNEFELKIDRKVTEEIKTLRFQKTLIGLLVKTYLNEKDKFDYDPPEVIVSKENWISTDNNTVDMFIKDFQITNNENDYITSEEIEYWIKTKDLGITMRKFATEMKKYAIVNTLNNVENKAKKINKKSKVVWFGIKQLNEEYDGI